MERMGSREAASRSRVPAIGGRRQVVRDLAGDYLPPPGRGQTKTASSRRGSADLAFSGGTGAATQAAPGGVIGEGCGLQRVGDGRPPTAAVNTRPPALVSTRPRSGRAAEVAGGNDRSCG